MNCDHSKLESNINSLISENRFLNSKLKEIVEIIEQSRMFDTSKLSGRLRNVNTTNILCKILDQDFDENKLSDDFRNHFKSNAIMIIGSVKKFQAIYFMYFDR